MAQILYTATDADGQPQSGMVEAAGVAQARDLLVQRGLSQVQIQQEAAFTMDVNAMAASSQLDPQQLAAMALRFIARPGVWTLLREVARGSLAFVLGFAAMAGYAVWKGAPLWAAAAGAVALAPFTWALWKYRRTRAYDQLVRAHAIGDWPAMLALADRLRTIPERTDQLLFDLDIRCAYARVRQGQSLDAAVASVEAERWRERLSERPGAYESQLALLHAAADRPQGLIDGMRDAAQACQMEPARVLDWALAEARFGDTDEAQRLFEGIDLSLLPPHGAGFIAWTRGLIALRHDEPTAPAFLADAVRAFLALSAHHPAVWTALAFSVADHARVLRSAGQLETARASLRSVWPILRAHARPQLLADLADLRPNDGATSASKA
jgi:hypothetical protein